MNRAGKTQKKPPVQGGEEKSSTKVSKGKSAKRRTRTIPEEEAKELKDYAAYHMDGKSLKLLTKKENLHHIKNLFDDYDGLEEVLGKFVEDNYDVIKSSEILKNENFVRLVNDYDNNNQLSLFGSFLAQAENLQNLSREEIYEKVEVLLEESLSAHFQRCLLADPPKHDVTAEEFNSAIKSYKEHFQLKRITDVFKFKSQYHQKLRYAFLADPIISAYILPHELKITSADSKYYNNIFQSAVYQLELPVRSKDFDREKYVQGDHRSISAFVLDEINQVIAKQEKASKRLHVCLQPMQSIADVGEYLQKLIEGEVTLNNSYKNNYLMFIVSARVEKIARHSYSLVVSFDAKNKKVNYAMMQNAWDEEVVKGFTKQEIALLSKKIDADFVNANHKLGKSGSCTIYAIALTKAFIDAFSDDNTDFRKHLISSKSSDLELGAYVCQATKGYLPEYYDKEEAEQGIVYTQKPFTVEGDPDGGLLGALTNQRLQVNRRRIERAIKEAQDWGRMKYLKS